VGYCTVDDLRDEKLLVGDGGATHLQALIDEATAAIDRFCGWHFDRRTSQTIALDGSGTEILHLPVHAIQVTEVRRVYRTSSPPLDSVLDPTSYYVYNTVGPAQDDRHNPKIQLLSFADGTLLTDDGGALWAPGVRNYEVDGDFGFVDDLGSSTYRTPLTIRRACMLWVARNYAPLGDVQAQADRRDASVDLRSHNVRGRNVAYKGPTTSRSTTGVIDVDRIIFAYRRPMNMRAA
jgi:hypothetical protein